jgi:ABC-type lipoprotein export system ATPase subunit
LLADEPTGELDEEPASTSRRSRSRARRRTAIVLVTHNAALAARARTHPTMRGGDLSSA